MRKADHKNPWNNFLQPQHNVIKSTSAYKNSHLLPLHSQIIQTNNSNKCAYSMDQIPFYHFLKETYLLLRYRIFLENITQTAKKKLMLSFY